MVQITIMDNQTKIETNDIEIFIEGNFEIKKKGAEAPTLEELPQHTFPLHTCNNLPPKI